MLFLSTFTACFGLTYSQIADSQPYPLLPLAIFAGCAVAVSACIGCLLNLYYLSSVWKTAD